MCLSIDEALERTFKVLMIDLNSEKFSTDCSPFEDVIISPTLYLNYEASITASTFPASDFLKISAFCATICAVN